MKVTNEMFYVVQSPSGDHIVDGEDEAIDLLRESGDEIDPEAENVTVVEVTYSGEDWTIKELPWQRIALRLLQEA